MFLSVVPFLVFRPAAEARPVLDTAAKISRCLASKPTDEFKFAITAKVTAVRWSATPTAIPSDLNFLALEDASGATLVMCPTAVTFGNGDLVRLEGTVVPSRDRENPAAIISRQEFLGHAEPARPQPVTFQTIQDGSHDYRLVRLDGTIRDAARSDTCNTWIILKIVCGENLLDVSVQSLPSDIDQLLSLIGSTVQIDGVVTPFDRSPRTNMGRIFWCLSAGDIRVLNPPNAALSPPDLDSLSGLHPSLVVKHGRHKTTGLVLATWNGSEMLLRTASQKICRVKLADGPLPTCGDGVEVIGFPESDLYHLNLVRASWTKSDYREPFPDSVSTNAPQGFLLLGNSQPGIIDMRHHGKTVQITGIARSLPEGENNDGIMYVQDGQNTVPVDISENRQVASLLSVGCQVRVTGTCVVDSPNWSPNALCQKHNRFFLVVRSPDDIVILSRPSWWTRTRLLTAGGVILILLVAILIWNRSLIILAERRGRELLREQIGRIRATLKVDERTRLAVELHDSLSQNLTGISLQLDFVSQLAGTTDPKITKHLDIAAHMLQSCRNELRGCIWDLRSQALDAPTLEDAIRMTLRPHLDAAKLSLRFPVPRRKLDDNSAHTLLRVIRELVSNALRHGGAKSVRIAGATENGHLAVSVQDDGTGFDPASRPNSGDGHFGLDGIRERLLHFDGKLTIDSSPRRGTKVTFSIRLPENGTNERLAHV